MGWHFCRAMDTKIFSKGKSLCGMGLFIADLTEFRIPEESYLWLLPEM